MESDCERKNSPVTIQPVSNSHETKPQSMGVNLRTWTLRMFKDQHQDESEDKSDTSVEIEDDDDDIIY